MKILELDWKKTETDPPPMENLMRVSKDFNLSIGCIERLDDEMCEQYPWWARIGDDFAKSEYRLPLRGVTVCEVDDGRHTIPVGTRIMAIEGTIEAIEAGYGVIVAIIDGFGIGILFNHEFKLEEI